MFQFSSLIEEAELPWNDEKNVVERENMEHWMIVSRNI